MWDFIFRLIYGVLQIWYTDSWMRNHDALICGSEFDRQSRRFVARLCGGVIVLLLAAGGVWWLAARK